MEQPCEPSSPQSTAILDPLHAQEVMRRLMETAKRLRKVRRAQRRFLRRWANERVAFWSRLIESETREWSASQRCRLLWRDH